MRGALLAGTILASLPQLVAGRRGDEKHALRADLADGLTVCCLELDQRAFHVRAYEPAQASQVGGCVLTAIAEGCSGGGGQCVDVCKRTLEGLKPYHEKILQHAQAEEGAARKRAYQYQAEASAAKQESMRKLQEKLAYFKQQSQTFMDTVSKNQQEGQRLYQTCQSQAGTCDAQQAKALVDQVGMFYKQAQQQLDSFNSASSLAVRQVEAMVTARHQAQLDEANRHLREAQKRGADEMSRLAHLPPQQVPPVCNGSDCCCTMGGVHMRVNGKFAAWSQCQSTAKYGKWFWQSGCALYTECSACAK